MLDFLKEYGVIAVLIAVALGGYFLVGDRRDELMDYTLEMLGSRLVDLAAKDDDRDDIARQFAQFQERVERDEVSPSMVEAVAANVLNLRARGAVITPEDVEIMLFSEPDTELPSPASPEGTHLFTVDAPPSKATSGKDLDERLKVLFQLADAVQVQGDSASYQFHFAQGEGGIHVVLDPAMAARLESGAAKPLYDDLARREWVKLQDNLARDQALAEAQMKRQAARLSRVETAMAAIDGSTDIKNVERWASAQKLAMLGATAIMDTTLLNREISTWLGELNVSLDSLDDASIRVLIQHESPRPPRSGN